MNKFIEYGVITQDQLEQARYLHRLEGGLIGEKLVELGFVTGEKMKKFAARIPDEM